MIYCISDNVSEECNVTYILMVIGQDVMTLPLRIMSNLTHILLVIGQDVVVLPFRQMWNITHNTLIIDKM